MAISTTTTSPLETVINDVTCGGLDAPIIMNNSNIGDIFSPGFPSPYPNEAECLWHVKVADNMVVSMTFVEFELEDGYVLILYLSFVIKSLSLYLKKWFVFGISRYDFIYIYDGDSIFSGILTEATGNDTLNVIRSSGSEITIQFRSDYSERRKGFHIQYRAGKFIFTYQISP